MADADWYVVHTYSGYENKVAQNIETIVENQKLQDLIFGVSVPTETVLETHEDGTQKEVERKIFPGYVLVKMVLTEDSWYIVRNISGVTGFVGPNSKPVPLTSREVEALGVEKKNIEISFEVGDSVKIVDGPLEGFIGIVEAIDIDKNQVKVTTTMFGKTTPVELQLNQVAAI